ncbi:uncharacterized protein LOC121379321 [Gigantopelta aegis]|uniref:uncharacterized protein LOC121379321 n=1 Tax=Gigantopelta aegis TaxID=1735272 RepID=UPI001B88D1A3|nr:uncharacterized protein LOC121379321 [Gigantopelta aegis]
MSRGVRDLRDLICVSRLSIRDSDEDVISDEEMRAGELENFSMSSSGSEGCHSSASKNSSHRVISPDSGVVINGSPTEQGACGDVNALNASQVKYSKKKRKKKALATFPPKHEMPKPFALPPVQDSLSNRVNPPSPSHISEKSCVSKQRKSEVAPRNFDDMMCYMDATIVAGWLGRANASVSNLAQYCNSGDNFVQFAHFWLSDFPDVQKHDIFKMENDILLEELGLVFAVGKEARKVLHSDIVQFASAIFREYPGKLVSLKGPHLFLDHLDVLVSEHTDQYKKLLSDVKCATRNRQYAQWLLATRSFALVSMWVAIMNFYRNLTGRQAACSTRPVSSNVSDNSIHQQRLSQAVRLGFVDVVHYLVVRGHVKPHTVDAHNRTVVFIAVMHKQTQILQYFLTRVKPPVDVNLPSDTGNTPLHAAVNNGSLSLVLKLLKCDNIDLNCTNPQCENATPLHLAVMHGNEDIVKALLNTGACTTAKMGDLTPMDIARDFGKENIVTLLEEKLNISV